MNEKPNQRNCIMYFGKFDKYIISLLIGGLTEFVLNWLYTFSEINNYSLIKCLAGSLGMCCTGIFFIYDKFTIQSSFTKKEIEQEIDQLENETEMEETQVLNYIIKIN